MLENLSNCLIIKISVILHISLLTSDNKIFLATSLSNPFKFQLSNRVYILAFLTAKHVSKKLQNYHTL